MILNLNWALLFKTQNKVLGGLKTKPELKK